MKKVLLSLAITLTYLTALGRPTITGIDAPSQVELYGKFEISFNMSPYSNPYDPAVIDAYAVFRGPNGQQFKVNAFYFEDYSFSNSAGYEVATATGINGWRIRFTPNCVGTWTYRITAKEGQSNLPVYTPQRQFTCTNTNNTTGFISKAHNRYLKQVKVENGQSKDVLYFPVGPNIAWYDCKKNEKGYPLYEKPLGIYYYFDFIDKLDGKSNYFRIFLNRYPHLSLYGKEYTNGTVYFDDSINQKDSKEFDTIVEYSRVHGISIMPCIFPHTDFVSYKFYWDLDHWLVNPYNEQIEGIDLPCDFFTNTEAKRITQNLIRYIVARWGYATNIMAWELFNEANQMEKDSTLFCRKQDPCNTDLFCDSVSFREDLIEWHKTMSQYIKATDPFQHLVTTSTTTSRLGDSVNTAFFEDIYKITSIDIAQNHRYKDINCVTDNFQKDLFELMKASHLDSTKMTKPCFIGEYGFKDFKPSIWEEDPYGIELHNSLWSSSFSGAMGSASIWWWNYLYNNTTVDLFTYFVPVSQFFNSMPIPSESFYPYSNKKNNGDYPNGIEAYYLMNKMCDTIYGWAHDKIFRYQKLRSNAPNYVTTLNTAYRPQPSSSSNNIKIAIQNQPIGAQYVIEWYDSETGNVIQTDLAYVAGSGSNTYLSFEFPSSIRNLQSHKICNNFGDVVFAIYLDCDKLVWKHGKLLTNDLNNVGDEIVCNKNTLQVFYKTSANKINSIWWNNNANCWQQANLNNAATNVKKCLAISDDGSRIFYINTNNNINSIYYNYATSQWVYDNMNNASQGNVEGPIAVNSNNQVFYRNKNNALNALWFDSQANKWTWSPLNNSASSGVGDAIAASPSQSQVFYKTIGKGLKAIKYDFSTSKWVDMSINCANSGVLGPITITPNNQVFFRTTSNTINNIYYNGSIWQRSQLNNSATNVCSSTSTAGRILQADVTGKVFYINSSKQVDCIYWTPSAEWIRFSLPMTENNVLALATNYDGNVYYLADKSMTGLNKNQIYRFLYKSQCFAESSSPNVRNNWDKTDDHDLLEETMNDLLFGVDENTLFDKPTVNIYPNPSSGIITLTSDDEINKVYVFDYKGILVASYENNPAKTIILDLSSYHHGLYIIKSQNHNGYTTINKINIIE